MIVTPEFTRAPWKRLLAEMTIRSFVWKEPLYLTDTGKLRPKPRWDTRFSLVQGPRPVTVPFSSFTFQVPSCCISSFKSAELSPDP